MGKTYRELDDKLITWIKRQKMFFVATAPLAAAGFVNCSPKGLDTFRVLEPGRVAYLDLTGSGVETIAHVKENGRILVMFCAFEGPPRILRLHGTAQVWEAGTPEFDTLVSRFPHFPSARALIDITLQRIADSCGYGVPLYEFREERDTLQRWADKKGADGIESYQQEKNTHSLDGLPGLREQRDV